MGLNPRSVSRESAEPGAPESGGLFLLGAEALIAFALCLAVLVVPLIFSGDTPWALDVQRPVSGFCSLVAGIGLLAWWAAGGRLNPKTRAMVRVLGLFLGAVAISTAASKYPLTSLREAWMFLSHAIFFVAAAVVFRRAAWARVFVAVFLCAAASEAAYGCCQAAGWDFLVEGGWFKERKFVMGWGVRVLGTMGFETSVGGYTASASVLALGAAVAARAWLARAGLGFVALLAAVCMVLSGTRTAWLGFAVGCAFVAGSMDLGSVVRALQTKGGKAVLVAAGAWLVVVGAIFGPTIARRLSSAPGELSVRTTIWRAALAMFARSPVVGMGPGTFDACWPAFRPLDYRSYRVGPITDHAHSEYLEVLAETGLVGAVPFALFIGLLFLGTGRAMRGGMPRGSLLPAAFGGALAMLVHALAAVDTRFPPCQLVLWVLMGLTVAQWDGGAEHPHRPPRKWAIPVVMLGIVAAIAVWTTQVWRPHLARVELRSATRAQRHGAWQRAIAHAQRAVALDGISVPSHYALANSLFHAREYELALAAFGRLQQHSPNYYDVHARVGVILAILGRFAEAREELELASYLDVAPPGLDSPEFLSDTALRELAVGFEQADAVRIRRRE